VTLKNNYAVKYYLDCTATDECPSAGWLEQRVSKLGSVCQNIGYLSCFSQCHADLVTEEGTGPCSLINILMKLELKFLLLLRTDGFKMYNTLKAFTNVGTSRPAADKVLKVRTVHRARR
jgi:hypothetical protein